MKLRASLLLSTFVLTLTTSFTGCVPAGSGGAGGGRGGNVNNTVSVNLKDDDVGRFEVTADEPKEKIILVSLTGVDFDIAGGTFWLDPAAMSFERSDAPGKEVVAAQITPFDFEVTGFAFPQDPLGECGTGDTYGPYKVSVDADGQAFAVDPSELDLQPDTITLIEEGNIAVCLRVVSPVSGVISIDSMEFGLTAGTTELAP